MKWKGGRSRSRLPSSSLTLEGCGRAQPWIPVKTQQPAHASIVLHGAEGPEALQVMINASMPRNGELPRYSNDNSTFSSGRAVS